MKTSRGFTLVEILTIVGIVAVLAALAVPVFLNYMAKSRRVELVTGLSGIFTVEAAYYANESVYQMGSLDCTTLPADQWDNNFSIGGFFNLSHPAKYYGFCIEVQPQSYIARGAGNIDTDSTLDFGQVTSGNRQIVIVIDDVITP